MTGGRLSAKTRYMLGMVVDATGAGMYLPLSLLYFHHVTGLPLTQVGTLMTAAAVIGLISNPAAGVLIDRFGAKAVVTGGYLLRAAGFCTYPLVDNGYTMFCVILLVALGDTSFPPAIQSFIAEFVKGTERDKLLAAQRSLRNAGLGVGGLIAGGVLALGSDAFYYVIVFCTAAGYVLAAVCFGSIPIPRTAPGAAATRVSRKGGYRLVARNRPFLALTLLNVPTAFGYTVLAVGIPAYVTQDLGASTSLVGVLYAVNTVGIALLQIPVTRALVAFRRSRAVALGAAVFAASFVVFATLAAVGDNSVILVGIFAATVLFTAGELLHGATASALCAQAAPEETRGRHLAVYQLSWAVPSALAPAVLTALLTLSPTAMWLVLAVGATVSALGVLRLEPRLPREAVYPAPKPVQSAPAEPARAQPA
ncbi:Na+/melibiose symporter-like transporter [Streptomyces sp. 3211.6]|uniref:MFS transporter n=1 Tax=Streptomyces TaxID=1883 RepID=UPI0009A53D25|nr:MULTISPECIES: MFS transporter [Streptomyces]RKT02638.1 Na+/melibiose symporter-like transporter [Streptomyces sp. 3211.6]RPF43963.1 Na+/melibiose symporter-like transporter [Streptomyces sp. Ag109_G2-6]